MKYMQKIAALSASLLLLVTLLSVSIFAEITPDEGAEMPGYEDGDSWSEEDSSSEESSWDDTSSEESSWDDTSSEESSWDDTSSEESSWDDTSSEESSWDDTSSEESTWDDTSSEESSWDDTSSQESSPSEAGANMATGENGEQVSSDASSGQSDAQASSQAAAANTEVNSSSAGSESSENYVVFGTIESKGNEMSDMLTMVGIVLIILGVVGLGCIIAWTAASRNTKKTPEQEVYEAVGMADARNRREQSADFAPYEDQQPVQRAPQRSYAQPPQVPPTVRSNPVHRPAQQPPMTKKAVSYDTEEIIREALKDRNRD